MYWTSMSRTPTLVALALVAMALGTTSAQQPDAPSSIRLVLPETENLTDLSVRYTLVGSFGSKRDFVRTQPGTTTYDISIRHEGQLAETIKGAIHLPGNRFVSISEAGLGISPPRIVTVKFEPLGTIPLKGRVNGIIPPGLQVDVRYVAAWMHSFFNVADGFVVEFKIDSVPLQADGTFSVQVPDYVSDPLVANYEGLSRGWISLIAREPETYNIAFVLKGLSKSAGSDIIGVPIAASYPGELQFEQLK